MFFSLFTTPASTHLQIQPPKSTRGPGNLTSNHINCTAGPCQAHPLHSGFHSAQRGSCQIRKLPLPILKLKNNTPPNLSQAGPWGQQQPDWKKCHPMRRMGVMGDGGGGRCCLSQPGPGQLVLSEAWAVGVAIVHPASCTAALSRSGPCQVGMRKMRQANSLRNKRHKASTSQLTGAGPGAQQSWGRRTQGCQSSGHRTVYDPVTRSSQSPGPLDATLGHPSQVT